MPIYAYRCATCGHAQDVLRKISDPPLNVCPACGASTFVKQVTAAGFQLKGSGWYVTDFRGDNKKPGKAADADAGAVAETNGAGASDAASATAPRPRTARPKRPSLPTAAAPAGAKKGDAAPAPAPAARRRRSDKGRA